jgi:hypothetical protein
MAQRRGGKSGLSSRVPGSYRLPNLDRINFASDRVLDALSRGAGCDAGALDPDWIDGEIKEVVSLYIAACEYASAPKTFRRDLADFRAALEHFIAKLPHDQSPIAIEIKEEWKRRNQRDLPCPICEVEQDSELIFDTWIGFERSSIARGMHYGLGAGLEELLDIVQAIAAAESGAGRDGNRPAHELVAELTEIYHDITLKDPTRDGAYDGKQQSTPFFEFVTAVDDLLPEPDKYGLGDIDSLIRLHLKRPG